MSLCVGSHLSRMLSPDLFSCSPCVCEYLGRGPPGHSGASSAASSLLRLGHGGTGLWAAESRRGFLCLFV